MPFVLMQLEQRSVVISKMKPVREQSTACGSVWSPLQVPHNLADRFRSHPLPLLLGQAGAHVPDGLQFLHHLLHLSNLVVVVLALLGFPHRAGGALLLLVCCRGLVLAVAVATAGIPLLLLSFPRCFTDGLPEPLQVVLVEPKVHVLETKLLVVVVTVVCAPGAIA